MPYVHANDGHYWRWPMILELSRGAIPRPVHALVVHHGLNIHHIRDQRLTGRCTATSNPYTPSAHANTPASADRFRRRLSGCKVLARILTAVEMARAAVASGMSKFRMNTITSISS